MSPPDDLPPARDPDRAERGRARLSEVHGELGEGVVDSLGDLGELISDFAYGDVYSRPGLTLRERQIVTVGMLAAMGNAEDQLEVHLRSALRVGATIDELREVIIQVVPYAGFPVAMNAMRRLQAVEAELGDGD